MRTKVKKFEGLFVNPFSEAFLPSWDLWKEYKLQTFRFSYKTDMSQQAAINELVDLSEGDEEVAMKIINQSISNQWMGLFKLKTLKIIPGGNARQTNSNNTTRESVNDELNKRFGGGK